MIWRASVIGCGILALLAVAATQLARSCPGAAELGNGIALVNKIRGNARITYASIDLGDGLYWQGWQSTVPPDGWQVYRYEGLFKVLAVKNDGTLRQLVHYDRPLVDIFPLRVGDRHTYGSRDSNEERGLSWTRQYELRVVSQESFTIAGCPYDGFELEIDQSYTRSDGVTDDRTSTIHYVPELKSAFGQTVRKMDDLDEVRLLEDRDEFSTQPVPDDVALELHHISGIVE